MDFIIFLAVCYSVFSILVLIGIVKKKDITNIMSYCCLYHVLTLSFVASHSTNKEITPNNLGILIFLYAIIGSAFYMLCCIILEKKKKKEEK